MSVEHDLAASLDRGEEVLTATVVRIDGRPPSRVGAKLLLGPDGPRSGTLGCSDFDAAAHADAVAVLRSEAPAVRTYAHELGTVEVLLEPYAARPTLVVGSATPVARHLLTWAPDLGFSTVLAETRTERLTPDFPAVRTVSDLTALDAALRGDVYAALTDHDSPDVVPLLQALVARRSRFIGVMGSRRHTASHLAALVARGVPRDEVDRIETPVGLALGGREPAEIALSILAGVVACRRGGGGGRISGGA